MRSSGASSTALEGLAPAPPTTPASPGEAAVEGTAARAGKARGEYDAGALFWPIGAGPALALARAGAGIGRSNDRVAGPLASVGECCEIRDQFGRAHLAEVIGFRGSNVLSMPVESSEGIRFGNRVEALGVNPDKMNTPFLQQCATPPSTWLSDAGGRIYFYPL